MREGKGRVWVGYEMVCPAPLLPNLAVYETNVLGFLFYACCPDAPNVPLCPPEIVTAKSES